MSIGFLLCLSSCWTKISFISSSCMFYSCVWLDVIGISVTTWSRSTLCCLSCSSLSRACSSNCLLAFSTRHSSLHCRQPFLAFLDCIPICQVWPWGQDSISSTCPGLLTTRLKLPPNRWTVLETDSWILKQLAHSFPLRRIVLSLNLPSQFMQFLILGSLIGIYFFVGSSNDFILAGSSSRSRGREGSTELLVFASSGLNEWWSEVSIILRDGSIILEYGSLCGCGGSLMKVLIDIRQEDVSLPLDRTSDPSSLVEIID